MSFVGRQEEHPVDKTNPNAGIHKGVAMASLLLDTLMHVENRAAGMCVMN